MLILNIDDDEDDGFIFMEAVREINAAITCLFITTGREAIQLLSNDLGILPDYIFLDINMPEMNGRECLVQIRKMEKFKDVSVVMLSTAILESDRPQYNELHAECFQKPTDFTSLKVTLKRIIGYH